MSADTIYALSSAPGRAGVAVVRVSGPGALASMRLLTRIENPAFRTVRLCTLLSPRGGDGSGGDKIDRALVLAFEGPNSFTGEDIVEYHIHGSPAVLDCLFSALSQCAGHRMAEPGEFTRRAFDNGRMDLTEAEAIADLIHAQTEMQRRQALEQMEGGLSRLYEDWRSRLIRAMAYVEAIIDFPDEDIPDSETSKILPEINHLVSEIEAHLNDSHRGEKLRDGFKVAILGAANAGKSSLLNALARRDVAIVSPLAGTTRDVIEAHLDLGGYPVTIADTAGLRPDADRTSDAHAAIEDEGIRRALVRGQNADLRLLAMDGTSPNPDPETLSLARPGDIILFTKADISPPRLERKSVPAWCESIDISSHSGENIEELLTLVQKKITDFYAKGSSTPSLTRARHRDALEKCRAHLRAASMAMLPELMAEDIRMAARELGRITGRVDVEDLLDVVFRDFCIGK